MIGIDVGGKVFKTLLGNLAKAERTSTLYMLYTQIITGTIRPDEHFNYFLDRDPKCFRYILNYLRDGRLILPNDGHTAAQLFAEAESLGLTGLAGRLSNYVKRNPGIVKIPL
ncbi:unnamed protein product [Caenorhabditis auriculariae]|uniref:Potassium channel tetramerisation-type BTB domain-containing protein n=1 Tax=Caenorhabditis auriculariae TaxID=2777116 RepID=A0A8S1HYT2_9PELO|nr:unnamed protein product [Caenorhabditis auriculariae]